MTYAPTSKPPGWRPDPSASRCGLATCLAQQQALRDDVGVGLVSEGRPAGTTSEARAAGRIAVTGASGFVGGPLCARLAQRGWRVSRLLRGRAEGPHAIAWAPADGRIDSGPLKGLDAVARLAGENLSAGRWTRKRKAAILRSRVDGTGLLARALAALERKPRALLSASAIGWYGDRGDEALPEDAGPGTGFLADACAQWERATEPAQAAAGPAPGSRPGATPMPSRGTLRAEGASTATTSRRTMGRVSVLFVVVILGSPGCKEEEGVPVEPDDSAALVGDSAVRALCGQRCYRDCERLVECGRYPGPAGGSGYAECVSACVDALGCMSATFDGLCPVEAYGTGRVITEAEQLQCENDARCADCWCGPGVDCWGPGFPAPVSCTAAGLCDPR